MINAISKLICRVRSGADAGSKPAYADRPAAAAGNAAATRPRRHGPGVQEGPGSPRVPKIRAKMSRLRPCVGAEAGRENPADPGTLTQDVADAALRQVEEQRRQLETRIREVNELGGRIRELTRDLQHQSQANRDLEEAHSRECSRLSARIEELTSATQHLRTRCQELEEHSARIEHVNALLQEAVLSGDGLYRRLIAARSREAAELAEQFAALRSTVGRAGGSPPADDALEDTAAGNPHHDSADAAAQEDAGSPSLGDNADTAGSRAETDRLDMLTGLYNRPHFIEVLQERLARGDVHQIRQSVYYVLLDNFAQIRKDIGFLNSDLVLQEISGLLKSHFTPADVVARIGDYAFSILRDSDGMEEARDDAERLRGLVESHVVKAGGQSVITTASIGICMLNEYTHSVDDILTRADLACEVARTSDGNRVHVHSTIIDEQIDHGNEENWDNVIRKTLDDKRFYLAYQPIVSLDEAPGLRYEVLLRILDEDGNIVLPGQFLSVAERIGLAVDIDRYVIETACRVAAESGNRDLQLFIKLSHAAIADGDLPQWIGEKLQECGIARGRLVFEVPERIVGKDLGNTARLGRALHDMGCLVAVEHYRGASRPQHLAHVHADILKIDGDLISVPGKNRDNRARVSAIVALARQNGMMVVAERVEDAASLALLWDYGIQYAQGNFIQEPGRKLDYDFIGEIVSEDVDDGRAIFATASRRA